MSTRKTLGLMGLWLCLDSRLISGVAATSDSNADDAKSWIAMFIRYMLRVACGQQEEEDGQNWRESEDRRARPFM